MTPLLGMTCKCEKMLVERDGKRLPRICNSCRCAKRIWPCRRDINFAFDRLEASRRIRWRLQLLWQCRQEKAAAATMMSRGTWSSLETTLLRKRERQSPFDCFLVWTKECNYTQQSLLQSIPYIVMPVLWIKRIIWFASYFIFKHICLLVWFGFGNRWWFFSE